MKSFEQFIKEEVDLRGNKGVPDDFMRKSDEEARKNLGVRPDDESQMRNLWPSFEGAMRQSQQILSTNPNGQRLSPPELQQRIAKLEKLAEKVIRDQFGDILDSSIKPIELDIKLVPSGSVNREIGDINQVPQQTKQPTEKDQEEQDKRDEEKDEEEKEECETCATGEEEEQEQEEVPGTDLVDAVEKKKILNMITQAAGKSTKDIIRASDIVDDGLQEIFGDGYKTILNLWVQMSDIADKMDWVIPIDRKASLMKNQPGGMAGAVQVKWESFSGSLYDMSMLLEKEASKIVIKSAGVDFPMLIHETIKGIFLFLQSGAIKKDKKTAEIVKKATSSFMDEAQDFRYGPPALQMLLTFVNKFTESNSYKRLETRVFIMLAVDKERAMSEAKDAPKEYKQFLQKKAEVARTDKQFLDIMKSMFSVFDNVERGGKIEFVINEEKFNKSLAKTEIKKIVDYIVGDIEDYKREIAEWEQEERERKEEDKYRKEDEKYRKEEEERRKEEESEFADESGKEEESEIDKLIKKTAARESEEKLDYSKMSQREIQSLVDDALDRQDYEEVKKLSQYLKEGKEIYLKEVERINESKKYRRTK
jgi:hypothetical protein